MNRAFCLNFNSMDVNKLIIGGFESCGPVDGSEKTGQRL